MPRRKWEPISFEEQMLKIEASKLNRPPNTATIIEKVDDLESIDERIKHILGLAEKIQKYQNRMIYFIMYDIASNKVRKLVSKFLIDKGCTRVQHSVFLADTSVETYNTIKQSLEKVQATYENNDSIFVLPITTDYLRMMKIIGQKVAVDVITHTKNTLFF